MNIYSRFDWDLERVIIIKIVINGIHSSIIIRSRSLIWVADSSMTNRQVTKFCIYIIYINIFLINITIELFRCDGNYSYNFLLIYNDNNIIDWVLEEVLKEADRQVTHDCRTQYVYIQIFIYVELFSVILKMVRRNHRNWFEIKQKKNIDRKH